MDENPDKHLTQLFYLKTAKRAFFIEPLGKMVFRGWDTQEVMMV